MKKLLSAIALIFAFTTSYGQLCGDLTITNNSGVDLYIAVGQGYGNCTANSINITVPNGSTSVIPSSPIYDYWLGMIFTTTPILPFPNPVPTKYHYENTQNPFTCTGFNSPGFTVTWPTACSVLILP